VNTECKAILVVAIFHNSFAHICKPAWCSNSRKLCQHQWRIYAKWRPWQNLNVRPF